MWCVRDGGRCPQKEEYPYSYVCGGEERTPGAKEKGDINFHGKWTPHLALLSAQKATETIISHPWCWDGEKAMSSSLATASEEQELVQRPYDTLIKSF